ncbi:MAG: prepilin peptidase [Lachnospiraceae bacterium]|nr:prepilin peptidase [Lachnospiraceae bacterium]
MERAYVILWGGYLLFLAIWDVKERRLSRWMLGAALLIALFGFFVPSGNWIGRILGAGIGALFCGISFISHEGIGWADSLLLLLLGVTFGGARLLFILGAALMLLLAAAVVLFILRKVKRKDRLPFMPFLFIGYVICCML